MRRRDEGFNEGRGQIATHLEITKKEDKQGFEEVEDAAKRGGKIAGNARKETEKELGTSVISKENNLQLSENKKKELS